MGCQVSCSYFKYYYLIIYKFDLAKKLNKRNLSLLLMLSYIIPSSKNSVIRFLFLVFHLVFSHLLSRLAEIEIIEHEPLCRNHLRTLVSPRSLFIDE